MSDSTPVAEPITLLCVIAAAAARGDGAGTADATRAALRGGATDVAVRGVLRMLHPFTGFPRALDAFAAATPFLATPALAVPEPADAGAAGRRVFDLVYGDDADRICARITALDPEALHRVLADAYGRVLSQNDISLAARERIAVVLLAAQGLRNQLAGHVRGALRTGAAPGDVELDLEACAGWIDAGDAAVARAALRAGNPAPRNPPSSP